MLDGWTRACRHGSRCLPTPVPCTVRDVTLAIETSNPSGVAANAPVRPGVALLRGAHVLRVEPITTDNPQHDDLMSAIDRACKAANVSPRDVKRIAVSIGPGGFTNVRIAVTCARMIAEATGAELVGVPTARVVALGTPCGVGPVAVALASKGDTAHVSVVSNGVLHAGEIMDATKLATLNVASVIADSYLPQPMRDIAAAKRWPVIAPVFDPVACARAAEGVAPVEPARLMPIYPREPEAVTKWRAMHAKKSD